MKFFTKILAVLLAGVMLLGITSCDLGNTPEDTTTAEEDTTTQVEEDGDTLKIVENGQTSYVLIYPESAPTNVMKAINTFIDAIENYTGAKIEKKDDYLGRTDVAGEKEILVGLTNREESKEVAETLRAGDYSVTVKNGKMLFCATTDSATANALNDFVANVLKSDKSLKAGTTNGNYSFSLADTYRYYVDYAIQVLTIGGAGIKNFRIVVPKDAYVEYYMALLLQKHLSAYAGYKLDIVTDEETAVDNEIIIGKTNRTTITAEDGTYNIAVTGTKLQVVCNSDFGYIDAYNSLIKEVFPYSVRESALDDTLVITHTANIPTNSAKEGTLRIMYHNTWGYYDGSNPVLNRSNILISVYEEYLPDVLCLQETSAAYRNSSKPLFNFLKESGYQEICYSDDGGIGNPIFYNENTLTLVESGYSKSRSGDKGTTWAVFTEKATGKTFAVTNSHFAANTNAGGDADLGNTYRTQDAQVVVNVTNKILTDYPNITIFSGGDYNSAAGSDPINTLTSANFVEVNSLATTKATRSPYHGTYGYDSTYGFYYLQSWLPYKIDLAIDHVMTKGATCTIHSYVVLQDSISLTSSDHAPHFVDVTLQ